MIVSYSEDIHQEKNITLVFGHVTQGKNKIANQVSQLPVYESDSKKDMSIYTTFLIHICVK